MERFGAKIVHNIKRAFKKMQRPAAEPKKATIASVPNDLDVATVDGTRLPEFLERGLAYIEQEENAKNIEVYSNTEAPPKTHTKKLQKALATGIVPEDLGTFTAPAVAWAVQQYMAALPQVFDGKELPYLPWGSGNPMYIAKLHDALLEQLSPGEFFYIKSVCRHINKVAAHGVLTDLELTVRLGPVALGIGSRILVRLVRAYDQYFENDTTQGIDAFEPATPTSPASPAAAPVTTVADAHSTTTLDAYLSATTSASTPATFKSAYSALIKTDINCALPQNFEADTIQVIDAFEPAVPSSPASPAAAPVTVTAHSTTTLDAHLSATMPASTPATFKSVYSALMKNDINCALPQHFEADTVRVPIASATDFKSVYSALMQNIDICVR